MVQVYSEYDICRCHTLTAGKCRACAKAEARRSVQQTPSGWQCPRYGVVHSPSVVYCPNCMPVFRHYKAIL